MTQALREKTSARRVLVILAGLLVMILALQSLASVNPGGFEANAATAPSPTPTGTAIQLINPSKKTSNELSDKDDGSTTDKNTYHLVAWTHLAPSGAGVQFKYDPSGADPEITIGNATQLANDTWEFHWDIPDTIPEAGAQTAGPPPRTSPTSGILRAILFDSSGRELARDEEDVSINNKDRASSDSNFLNENQAETVEITYPSNGGPVGFYGSQDGTYTGIIEVTTSTGDPAATVQAFYTVDPPGVEPNFISCSTAKTVASKPEFEPGTTEDGGLRCTLASGDRPSQVTAVAAVITDKSDDPGPASMPEKDSSDAHRTFGYEQDPSSVTITPSSDTEDVNKCNDPSFRVVVTDSSGQQVAGANVDIHAQGPTDNLHFDDSGNRSSAHQPPDGGTHAKESGVDCESTNAQPVFAADVQGDHENLTTPDIKHIESTVATNSVKTGGTDDAGSFTFALLSRDAGGTQITAFVDEDFNDRHCSEEAAGHASIGWGGTAPSPTGTAAEDTSCPKPTPGQTTTPTSSPTATSTTARPTGSPTSTGPTTGRTVTMAVDRAKVPAGRTVTFGGQILSQDQSCVDNEFVEIRRRIHGTTSSVPFETTATNSEGRFELRTRVNKSATYIAVAPAHDNCREASSGEVTVLVKVVVQLVASDRTPQRGDRFTFKSSVRPQHDGTTLVLQRKKGRRWVTVDRDKLNNRSIASFTVVADFDRRTFRTKWRSQDSEHETGVSPTVTIRSR